MLRIGGCVAHLYLLNLFSKRNLKHFHFINFHFGGFNQKGRTKKAACKQAALKGF